MSRRFTGGLVLLGLLLGSALHAAPGDLDATFGGSGIARVGFGFGDDYGRAVAVQSDGKWVVAGYSTITFGTFTGDVTLVRYNPDHSLDMTFGIEGKVVTPLTPKVAVVAVKVQADGKIVVAGSTNDAADSDIVVLRYHGDGSLDASFGGDGIVTTHQNAYDRCGALAVDASGRILVAGATGTVNSTDFLLIRYNGDGTLDTSLGGDGVVVTSPPASNAVLNGIVIQPDGKIVVAGTAAGIAVARYLPGGALDTSFSGDGLVSIPIGSTTEGLAVTYQLGNGTVTQPDRLVVAGRTWSASLDVAVVRLDLDGSLDASFDSDGIVTTPVGPSSIARAVVVQRSGQNPSRILVAGSTYNGTDNDVLVVKYLLNGSLDTAFDGDGKAVTSIGPGEDEGLALVLQGSQLTVVGTSETGPQNSDFAMVRYSATNGALDPTFDEDGMLIQDVADRAATARDVAIQPDGKLVLVGDCEDGAGRRLAMARFHADGTLDHTFGTRGRLVTLLDGQGGEGWGLKVQSDGKIVAAGASYAGGFGVARFHPDGTFDSSWGGDGAVTTAVGSGSSAVDLAIQPDGMIVVAGNTDNGANTDFAVVRYQADGSLDATFDGDGIAVTAVGSEDDQAYAIALQPDGKIVLAGAAFFGGLADIALVRYQTNGALDLGFGSFGRVATDMGASNHDVAYGMAIQPDGRIAVAGLSYVGASTDVAVARYLPSGSLDTSFDGDGRVLTPIGLAQDFATALALQADGKLLIAGRSAIGSDVEVTAARYDPGGSLDGDYGLGGKVVVDAGDGDPEYFCGLAIDAMGRAVIAGQSQRRFAVIRLLGDGGTTAVSPLEVLHPRNRIVGVAPNPGLGGQAFELEVVPGQSGGSLEIFDVAGHRIWSHDAAALPAGTHRVVWKGTDGDGAAVPPGVYFARFGGTAAGSRRIVRIR